MTTTAAAFAIPAGRGEDVALVNHWLSHLAGAREIAGYEARLTTTSDGPVANYHVVQPTAAACALLAAALGAPGRLSLLARLWCLPACAHGLAQGLDRTVPEVVVDLRAMAALGVVHELRGIWYARPFQCGGRA